MICYLDSCRDKVLKVCTPTKFQELTESQRTSMLIDAYRSGENPDAKSQLPAFVFMGYDPKMLEIQNDRKTEIQNDSNTEIQNGQSQIQITGSRRKSDLVPTGLVMFDFDHLKERYDLTPYEAYDRFLKIMPKLGLTLDGNLALAHNTCSNNGLRTVIFLQNGKTIAQIQEQVSELLGIECDKAVKDLSRLSFCPKAEDILYINKSLLFGAIESKGASLRAAADGGTTDDPRTSYGVNKKDSAFGTESAGSEYDLKPETEVGRPTLYHGVPYKAIVEKWIELRGGKPEQGDRHATLVELAMDLRKICDNDKEWIASLMPDFDKGEQEKIDCIEWAVGRQHSKISGTLLQVLQDFNIVAPEIQKYRNTEGSGAAGFKFQDSGFKFQDSSSSASADSSLFTLHSSLSEQSEDLPPAMPQHLPRLIRLMTSKVLPHQRPAVSAMIFPALATHVNNCQFKLRDNTNVELALMCCLLAPQSVGKGCVNEPLRLIMADIEAEDEINRQRERDWSETQRTKKANEKGVSKPKDLIIRYLSSDTTTAAFLERLFAAQHGSPDSPNLCTYSQVEEIEDLWSFCATGGRNKIQQMIKRGWDRGRIGAERFTATAANYNTVLRWNWAASSTIDGGRRFFKSCLTDGTTSRVDFCTIIPPGKVIDFCYGDYDEEFEELLKPYIDNLKNFECEKSDNGRIIPKVFPQIRDLEERMNAYINETASSMPDSTWENYAWRAKVMAIKKLIVLYIANGCEWEAEFEDFIWWSFHYSMWCKMNLFYDSASAQFLDERLESDKGHKSPLKSMKRRFTFAEFNAECQRQGYRAKPTAILRKYKFRGIIAQNGDMYDINPEWADKNGLPEE